MNSGAKSDPISFSEDSPGPPYPQIEAVDISDFLRLHRDILEPNDPLHRLTCCRPMMVVSGATSTRKVGLGGQ